ncbi:MAG: hypothetical protein ACNI26_13005 [Terasakiella sp.]|uniref:hypothetical protein n=1 Tax=unclassified Terasakiella TaxID=2614952 RepID=UPI003AFF8E16
MSGRNLAEMARGLTAAQIPELTSAHIAADSITSAKLAINAVGADALDPSVTPVLTKYFESGELAISPSAAHVVAHGLGVTPKLVEFWLVCKIAEHGYSVDDKTPINPSNSDISGSINAGLSAVPNATDITIELGARTGVFYILSKTTNANVELTPANWRLIVRAWA